MASATFLTWITFKNQTPATLTGRYWVKRAGDDFLSIAMGVTTSSAVHFYVPPSEEEIKTSGLGADLWFVGAIEVATVA